MSLTLTYCDYSDYIYHIDEYEDFRHFLFVHQYDVIDPDIFSAIIGEYDADELLEALFEFGHTPNTDFIDSLLRDDEGTYYLEICLHNDCYPSDHEVDRLAEDGWITTLEILSEYGIFPSLFWIAYCKNNYDITMNRRNDARDDEADDEFDGETDDEADYETESDEEQYDFTCM
jgi:hypothetical protein